MTNIILQHFDGDLRELDRLSMVNIQQYADTVSADYRLITGKPFREHLTSPCQKVYMLDEEFDKYDDVLMLDIDMFAPKSLTENVFEQRGIGLYAEVQQRLHSRLASSGGSQLHPYWGGAIYKMSREQRQHLRKGLGGNERWMNDFNVPYRYEDEGIMHMLAKMTDFKPKHAYMSRKWCQCSFLPKPENAGFIHIRTKVTPTGPKREKIENYKALVDQGIL